jgi:hypothetical protein
MCPFSVRLTRLSSRYAICRGFAYGLIDVLPPQAGVTDVVLAVNYRPEVMVAVLKETEEQYGINITFSVETEPLGTAGPLALAREILGKDDSPFFVLNSDVTCTYPFEQFRWVAQEVLETSLADHANPALSPSDFHMAHGCEGSIMVTKVAEPSAFGVVVTKSGSSVIERFVEKPVEFVGNRINAGIYMFNPSVLDRIEVRRSRQFEMVETNQSLRHVVATHFDRKGDLPRRRRRPTTACLRLARFLDGRRTAQGLSVGYMSLPVSPYRHPLSSFDRPVAEQMGIRWKRLGGSRELANLQSSQPSK